jgi:RNA polymerase sigma-70 factor (ECF subfamily)
MATGRVAPVIHALRTAASLKAGPELSDADLLNAFLVRRDDLAFAMLLRRHGPLVLGVCRRLLRNEEDAAEAFQAVFLVLAQKARSIRSHDALAAWLYGVAYRTSLKARARLHRQQTRETVMANVPDRHAEMHIATDDMVAILDEELNALPDKYRIPVVLCELQGQPRSVAARALKIPEGTLSSRLATARRMLRERFVHRGITLSVGALALALSASASTARVPTRLLAFTAKVAAILVDGGGTAAVVSAKVLALNEGVLKAMFVSKLKIGMGLLFALSIMGGSFILHVTGTSAPHVFANVPAPAQLAKLKRDGPQQGPDNKGVEREKTDQDRKRDRNEQAALQGTWIRSSVTIDGQVKNEGIADRYEMIFKVNKVTTRWESKPDPNIPGDKGKKGEVACTFALDTSKTPKELTLTGVNGNAPKLLGIYKLEKDTLTFATFGMSEVKRPKGFSPTDAGDKDMVLVLELFKKETPDR